MSKFQFTPQAADDLIEIWSYIAQDNPRAANQVEASVFHACELLAGSPLAGQVRRDLTPLPVRFWVVHPYSNYLIVYDPESKPIRIIRILHGARNVPSVLA
jgi:plasmid stabilization system protein ParE